MLLLKVKGEDRFHLVRIRVYNSASDLKPKACDRNPHSNTTPMRLPLDANAFDDEAERKQDDGRSKSKEPIFRLPRASPCQRPATVDPVRESP